jgi:hypothetical protein
MQPSLPATLGANARIPRILALRPMFCMKTERRTASSRRLQTFVGPSIYGIVPFRRIRFPLYNNALDNASMYSRDVISIEDTEVDHCIHCTCLNSC